MHSFKIPQYQQFSKSWIPIQNVGKILAGRSRRCAVNAILLVLVSRYQELEPTFAFQVAVLQLAEQKLQTLDRNAVDPNWASVAQ